jgi:hypothetical protein
MTASGLMDRRVRQRSKIRELGTALLRVVVWSYAAIGFVAVGRHVATDLRPLDAFVRGSVEAQVAADARLLVLIHRDHPLQRVMTPQAKVIAVDREAASCDLPTEDQPGPPLDYVATVRVYGLYRIPWRVYRVTCGGRMI